MKLLVILTIIMILSGCGKKVDDTGPRFALDLNASQDGLKDGVITRDDENSGPSYSLSASGLQSIEYVDKKVVCGNITVTAKRTLKTDIGFQTFKISEAEFHGLNQLPKRPSCTLQLTAVNGTGSTVTRNIPLTLSFDKSPLIQINRNVLIMGQMGAVYLVDQNQVRLESYEILNPLQYDVPFVFAPTRSVQVWGVFTAAAYNASATCSHLPVTVSSEHIVFDPPTTEVTGDIYTGFRFKVKAGQSLKVTILGSVPIGWIGKIGTSVGEYTLKFLSVAKVMNWEKPTLFQAVDFEFKPQELLSPETPALINLKVFSFLQAYDPGADPAWGRFIKNPDL